MEKQSKHGEVIIATGFEIPETAKKIEIKDDFLVVGLSETTGNDHRIAVLDKKQIEFFEDKDGTLYMRNLVKTEVYCPNAEKHTSVTLEPNTYRINKAQEYDYLAEMVRDVTD